MVQIMGLLVPIVLFSVRMVKSRGLKLWQFPIWVGILGLLGMAGYMEYYVQRNAHKAVMAYSIMGSSLVVVVIFGLLLRFLAHTKIPAEDTLRKAE